MNKEFNLDAIDKTFVRFKEGEIVRAKIVSFLKESVLLSIGGKKDGIIKNSEEENNSTQNYKIGDEIDVCVVGLKDESGAIILSKSKADKIIEGNKLIKGLKIGDFTSLIITDADKAGLISKIGDFEVFIPFSQISNTKIDNNLKNYINKKVFAFILEINLEKKKIIASIKEYENKEKQKKEDIFWSAIFENKIVSGKVVRFVDFGAFVNIDGVDCLLHNNECSYDKNKKASNVLELDKTYEFKIIKCDKENKRISLSYKVLQTNPLTEKLKNLQVGEVVNGEVIKLLPFGAIIRFRDDLEGLLHVKEASKYYLKNIYEVAKVGQKLDLKIISIDLENNKVSLSLKAMNNDED